MRIIKFKVLDAETKELIGYERIGDKGQWEFLREHRTEWLLGAITDGQEYRKFIRLQFTGLLDKNGKEIYEGDIVACDIGFASWEFYPPYYYQPKSGYGNCRCKAIIEFKDCAFKVKIIDTYPDSTPWHEEYKLDKHLIGKYKEMPDKIEVIGNVHDNKDLIK